MVYPLAKIFIIPAYKLWIRKMEGLGHIPPDEPFIIASNHASFYDDLISPSILIPKLDKHIHSLVNSRFWRSKPVGMFLDWGQCIPVYVGKYSDKEKNKKAFERALDYLEQGHLVQIFPEGTRSVDGKFRQAKPGVARLAIQSGCKVLPMGIIGSRDIMPKGALFPRFKRCDVKLGKPLIFEKNTNPTKENLEKTTRKIMQSIGKLIGQEYPY